MNLWLIVPIKPLSQGKSRLEPSLSALDRRQLNQKLLERTLSVVSGVDELAGVIVVSRDGAALLVAEQAGAIPVIEIEPPHHPDQATEPESQLNNALRQARENAIAQGADAILVLPADLPLLSSTEILMLIQQGKALQKGLVIVPSRDGGTNAMLLTPPDAIDFAYGPNSFHRHIQKATESGLPTQRVESTVLAFDLTGLMT